MLTNRRSSAMFEGALILRVLVTEGRTSVAEVRRGKAQCPTKPPSRSVKRVRSASGWRAFRGAPHCRVAPKRRDFFLVPSRQVSLKAVAVPAGPFGVRVGGGRFISRHLQRKGKRPCTRILDPKTRSPPEKCWRESRKVMLFRGGGRTALRPPRCAQKGVVDL